MPQVKITDYFLYKSVTPSALEQDNLISFSYKSPNGVHDKNPLVYVLEKRLDRIFGLNLHYNMAELPELVEATEEKINRFIENEWYRKHPDKLKELREKREVFDISMVEEKELPEIKRKINRKDLEQFLVTPREQPILRTYLYSRMNRVSKLTWKL